MFMNLSNYVLILLIPVCCYFCNANGVTTSLTVLALERNMVDVNLIEVEENYIFEKRLIRCIGYCLRINEVSVDT